MTPQLRVTGDIAMFLPIVDFEAEFGQKWSVVPVGGKSRKLGQICSSPAEIPPLMLPHCGCGVRGCRWADGGEGGGGGSGTM